ncbi:GTPase-activating protein gyp8 [Pyricularia oryzae]
MENGSRSSAASLTASGSRESSVKSRRSISSKNSSFRLPINGDDEQILEQDMAKADAISEACKFRKINRLKELAVSRGGFLSDRLRRQAWPVLLGLEPESDEAVVDRNVSSSPVDDDGLWKEMPRHRDEDQVQLDVNRAFIYYPNIEDPIDMEHQKAELSMLIVETEPFFALSGTLTMYAHDVQTLGEIARLFDALLAMEPVFSVYVFAAIVMSRRAELFDTPPDEPEMLHSILSKLPQPLDLDDLLARAVLLAEDHPPETLPNWRRGISPNSVLKTARDSAVCAKQTLDQGRQFFERQVRELEWDEKREKAMAVLWAYRKPARTIGFAVAFGILAFWLRRSPGPLTYIASMSNRWLRD